MNQEFYDAVEANPVIAAVKSDAGLQAAVEMEEIQVSQGHNACYCTMCRPKRPLLF